MSDSVCGSVVVGGEVPAGVSCCQLCQMLAARASSRVVTRVNTPARVRPPCRSRLSCPLAVSKTDWTHCPSHRADRSGVSHLAVWAQERDAEAGDEVFEFAAGEALVGEQHLPGRQRPAAGDGGHHVALGLVGRGQREVGGVACLGDSGHRIQ